MDVSQLARDLDQKDANLKTAAELGKALLEENSELKEQLEEIVKKYSKKLEVSSI